MPSPTLAFTSKFLNNSLFILDALCGHDMQTARRLADEVTDITSQSNPGYCRYIKIASSAHLEETLLDIHAQCAQGVRPIIHFEAHGDDKDGIQIGATGEMVSWNKLLEMLRAINRKTRNNLGVVMAACYGLHALKPMRIMEPTPFYFLIGSETPVMAGYIDERMVPFYRSLVATGSLTTAMGEINGKFDQFHCEKFFFRSFATYMKRNCIGKAGERRVEELVTKAFEKGMSRENIRKVRAQAKKARKAEADFHRFADTFLHHRKSISFAELQSFLRSGAQK